MVPASPLVEMVESGAGGCAGLDAGDPLAAEPAETRTYLANDRSRLGALVLGTQRSGGVDLWVLPGANLGGLLFMRPPIGPLLLQLAVLCHAASVADALGPEEPYSVVRLFYFALAWLLLFNFVYVPHPFLQSLAHH